MYKFGLNLKRLLLLAGDFAAFELALVLTLVLRYGRLESTAWSLHETPFAIVIAAWIIGLYVAGLYDLTRAKNTLPHFRTFLESMFVNLLIAVSFFYLIPVFGIEPRTNLFLFFAISLFLIYAWRLAFNRFIAKGLFRTRLCYIGPAEDAVAFRGLIAQNTLGFQLVGIMTTTPYASRDADGVIWTDRIESLPEFIVEQRIDAVVLGHRVDEIESLREALYRSLNTSVALIDRRDIEEILTGRVPVTSVDKAWFLRNLRESEKAWFEAVKRGTDILLAIPFGLLTIGLTPFVALFMLTTSEGHLFFRQKRVGKNGKNFEIIKFRTMNHPGGRLDAEMNGAQFAVKDDARITKIGRFLRVTRIDELPQVWNVLKGDMSFVGPRPERPEFVSQLTERMPYYALRHLTRPGLTGWAQVKYDYASTLDDNLVKLQYDLYYVKHRSLLLDFTILLKTIDTVLRRKGT
jgi:exopolysaccharide biosynthesis polyprenyl glycosylphosphotransferase